MKPREVIGLYLLGLDIGTTGCKAVVYDLEGKEKGYGFREYGILCEKPNWAEQDPLKIWGCVKEVISCAVAQAKSEHSITATDIKALGISVQGEAIIPVDRNIKPLYNTMLGMDYRATKQVEWCSGLMGDRQLFQRTGLRPHPMSSISKMIWMKENLPDIYERAYKIMTYSDFIFAKMGIEPVIDYSQASRTMAFNITEKDWDGEILKRTGIDAGKLSQVVPSGTVVGKMSETVASELGLHKEVLLVSGGHDQTCAGIGAGAVCDDIAINSTGTAEVLGVAFSRQVLNDTMFDGYYPCYCHAKQDMYFTLSINQVGGLLLKWYRDNFAAEEVAEAARTGRDPFAVIDDRAARGPSKVFVLPHLIGSGTPWCDFESKGAIVGLTMGTTRHDIAKAIFDSLTYELKVNIRMLEKAGIRFKELRSIGGAAKSSVWMQVKADVLNCRVSTLESRETGCLGAAILAGAAIGAFRDIDEAVSRIVRVRKVYEPNPEMTGLYAEQFEKFLGLYPALKGFNAKL